MSNAAKFEVPDSGDNGKTYVYNSGSDSHVMTSLAALYQPLDSDLTAIAALTTTTFGRALLALADAAALRTAADVGSATVGGDLTGTVGNAQIAAGAVGATELASDAVTNAKVADDAIGIAELSATGTVTSSLFLRGDNKWAAPTIDQTKLRRWRAAVGKILAGTADARVLYFGDSTSTGFPTGSSLNSAASLVAGFLESAKHIPAGFNGVFRPQESGVATDSRLSYGSWVPGTHQNVCVATATDASTVGTFSFTPPDEFDTINIWTVRTPGFGTITVNVGGSTLATINCDGVAALVKTTISCPSGSTVVNVVGASGAGIHVKGIETSDSTNRRVLVHDFAKSGAGPDAFITDNSAFSDMDMYDSLAAPLAIINMTINPINQSVPVNTYIGYINTLTARLVAAGADIILVIGATPENPPTTPSDYYSALYALGYPVLDLSDRWGDFTSADALGLMYDDKHPNLAGLKDTAMMVADGLSVVGDEAAAGAGGASDLNGLSDVAISSPSTGQVLKYDGAAWINDTDAGAGGALDDLSDVTITGASNGQVLKYNGSAWVNDTDATSAGTTIGALFPSDMRVDATRLSTFPGVNFMVINSSTSTATTVDRMYFASVVLASPITVTQVHVEVTTAAAASSVLRMGIYEVDDNWNPTDLLADWGTVAVDSTGAKSVTGLSTSVPAGRYALAWASNGSPTLRTRTAYLSDGFELRGVSTTGLTTNIFGSYPYASFTYATFPSTAPAFTSSGSVQASPLHACPLHFVWTAP